jgi:tRNA threonylcarbamoyladenosine biosynthesis protein TsaE
MLTLQAATPGDLGMVASQIIQALPGKRIFALYGTMGAGKTTLIKSLCYELDVTDVVLSPTFALINEYRTRQGEPVYHFDFYRIKSLSEAYDMGYEEYFYSNHYCFIEWPEKIEQLLPPGFVYIDIRSGDSDQTRTINVR